MATGHWIVRVSLLLNVSLVIALVSIYDPTGLQAAASHVFFFEKDPTLALWSFYGLVVGLATFLGILAIKSIGDHRLEQM